MGQCYARNVPHADDEEDGGGVEATASFSFPATEALAGVVDGGTGAGAGGDARPSSAAESSSATRSPVPSSPLPEGSSMAPSSPPASSAACTPRRFFRSPFPPPSPAKHIKASLARRFGFGHRSPRTTTSAVEAQQQQPAPPVPETPIQPEQQQQQVAAVEEQEDLDKNFGYDQNFDAKYELLGQELGHGHFGHTCLARAREGDMAGQVVAVKVISKAKMTTTVSIEDVSREVKILKALSSPAGHSNLVRFHEACEDEFNVYIIMELCEGGELLDRILSRGGRYQEDDAKLIVEQILSGIAFCHLQGVVHRDLKPENFLFSTRDEDSLMKIIDFGLSDFVSPDARLRDIVGSAYYVAPEVLHRSYNTEADMWSIGVITFILLCGSRPFWARTESGIFRSVLRVEPNFYDSTWQYISPEAKDFVSRLLNKDLRKRMTASQALSHPRLQDEQRQIPLDIQVFKLVRLYLCSTPLKRAALKALSKAITEDELIYIRAQYNLLEPCEDGRISFENFRKALLQRSSDAMIESRTVEILNWLGPLAYRKMDFEEFCAATISPNQVEASPHWEEIATAAFENFEEDGNRAVTVQELIEEMHVSGRAHDVFRDWIRPSDGKLSFVGYRRFLRGIKW